MMILMVCKRFTKHFARLQAERAMLIQPCPASSEKEPSKRLLFRCDAALRLFTAQLLSFYNCI